MEANAKVKLTGLWRGETKDGEPYLSGQLSGSSKLFIYKNRHKKNDGDPDFVAYLVPAKKRHPTHTTERASDLGL